MAKPNNEALPRRCEKVKRSGERCAANAQLGSRWCFFHDPAKAAERTAARRAGGNAARTVVVSGDLADVKLESIADVVALLAETTNRVRRLPLDARVANCIGYLAGQMVTAMKESDLEQRLAELERRLAMQHQGGVQ
jgi:hypothetical protein